jgi:hypothetical protein
MPYYLWQTVTVRSLLGWKLRIKLFINVLHFINMMVGCAETNRDHEQMHTSTGVKQQAAVTAATAKGASTSWAHNP